MCSLCICRNVIPIEDLLNISDASVIFEIAKNDKTFLSENILSNKDNKTNKINLCGKNNVATENTHMSLMCKYFLTSSTTGERKL